MSRYTFPGENPRYRISVGVGLQLSTMFAGGSKIWPGRRSASTNMLKPEAPLKLLVWVGSCACEILDVQELVQTVAPYGHNPISANLRGQWVIESQS